MPYTIDDCPHIGCQDCLYDFETGNCKRIDGEIIRFAKPWFACCASGFHVPCKDFVPKHPEYADMKKWTNFQEFWDVYKIAWLSVKEVAFFLNGDASVTYYVDLKKFVDGTMVENGVLQANKKSYYTRVNSGCGYKLITEKIDGVIL